jgi:hypothetical protein
MEKSGQSGVNDQFTRGAAAQRGPLMPEQNVWPQRRRVELLLRRLSAVTFEVLALLSTCAQRRHCALTLQAACQ